jgi:hypothetical protein
LPGYNAVVEAVDMSEHGGELPAGVPPLAAVAELGRRALTGTEPPLLMAEAVDVVRSSLGVEDANVLELLPDGRLLFRAGAGWKEGLVGQAGTEAANAIPAAQVLHSQTPVVVGDLRTDGRFPDAALLRDHGVVSSLNVVEGVTEVGRGALGLAAGDSGVVEYDDRLPLSREQVRGRHPGDPGTDHADVRPRVRTEGGLVRHLRRRHPYGDTLSGGDLHDCPFPVD